MTEVVTRIDITTDCILGLDHGRAMITWVGTTPDNQTVAMSGWVPCGMSNKHVVAQRYQVEQVETSSEWRYHMVDTATDGKWLTTKVAKLTQSLTATQPRARVDHYLLTMSPEGFRICAWIGDPANYEAIEVATIIEDEAAARSVLDELNRLAAEIDELSERVNDE